MNIVDGRMFVESDEFILEFTVDSVKEVLKAPGIRLNTVNNTVIIHDCDYLVIKDGKPAVFPQIGKNGFLRTWAGITIKVYSNQSLNAINPDWSETVVWVPKTSKYCSFFQAGILVMEDTAQSQFIVLDAVHMKSFTVQSKYFRFDNLPLVLQPSQFGLSLSDKLTVKIMGK